VALSAYVAVVRKTFVIHRHRGAREHPIAMVDARVFLPGQEVQDEFKRIKRTRIHIRKF